MRINTINAANYSKNQKFKGEQASPSFGLKFSPEVTKQILEPNLWIRRRLDNGEDVSQELIVRARNFAQNMIALGKDPNFIPEGYLYKQHYHHGSGSGTIGPKGNRIYTSMIDEDRFYLRTTGSNEEISLGACDSLESLEKIYEKLVTDADSFSRHLKAFKQEVNEKKIEAQELSKARQERSEQLGPQLDKQIKELSIGLGLTKKSLLKDCSAVN